MSIPAEKPAGLPESLQMRLQTMLPPARTRILLAEDDPVSARILQAAISKLGYEPMIVRDGVDAWEQFDREPFRLIVSDWMMPGLDGLALCEKVRARSQTPYTYFILLTANHTSAANHELASAAGVDDFLTKPLDREVIRARLRVAERILKYTAEISQLREMIPICVYCRKVRDGNDYWDRIESYLHKQTGSRVTHAACPECYEIEVERLLLEPNKSS